MVATRFRRVWIGLLLGALLAAACGTVSAQTVRDVPPDHWAYEAVMELVNRGYIAVEEGFFRGDQPVDRFTLATVVARLLHEVERGGVQIQSERDVELIRSVVTEFREDLVRAFARIDQTDARVDAAVRDVDVIRDKISEVIDELDAAERRFAVNLAELDAKTQAELQAQVLQLQGNLTQLRQLLDQRTQELASGQMVLRDDVVSLNNQLLELIAELREELRADYTARIATLEANVRQALADSGIALGGLQESLEADAARLRQLEEQVRSISSDLDALTEAIVTGVEQVLAEIRSELNAQAEALAAGQLALEELRAEMARRDQALADTDAELLRGVEAALERIAALQQDAGALESQTVVIEQHVSGLEERLASLQAQVDALASVSGRLDAMKAQIDGVERQVLAMQSQIGLSEEQLRALSDRLMNELESQYQHSFLLAGTLQEELKALREEFNSYRQNTERELASARQGQLFGMVGALLALIGLVN